MNDVYFEDWDASYGSPYLISGDQADGIAQFAEAAEKIRVAPVPCAPRETAFVDGVRRGEGLLYRQTDAGVLVRGTVGAHACGAVLCDPGSAAVFGPIETRRLVIFGGGVPVTLPEVDGYRWDAAAISSLEPDAPLEDLQTRMRMAEGELAELSGDLVEFDATPYAGDAYFKDWPRTLESVAKLGARALVPGRGPALIGEMQVAAGLKATGSFIADVRDSVAAGVAAGKDLNAVYKETFARLKSKYGHWVIFDHCMPFDVTRAYDEATQFPDPRIWTAERDRVMWETLES